MKILFAITLIAAWVLGIYEGDCTAAAMFSFFGAIGLIQGSRKIDIFFGKRRSRPQDEVLAIEPIQIKRTSFDEDKLKEGRGKR